MGIVNVTPTPSPTVGATSIADRAVAHGLALAAAGAAVIDVGGESTRPGADPVDAERRAPPGAARRAGAGRAHSDVRVSIDTTKALGGRGRGRRRRGDGERRVRWRSPTPRCSASWPTPGAAYVVDAHARHAATMQRDAELRRRGRRGVATSCGRGSTRAIAAGIDSRAVLADPGIGFAKTAEHNVALLRALPEIAARVGMPAAGRHVAEVVPRPHRRRRVGARSTTTRPRHDGVVFRTGRGTRARSRRRGIAPRGRAARDDGTRDPRRPRLAA